VAKVCPRCSEPFPDDAAFCPFDGGVLEKSNDKFLGKTIAARYRLMKKLGAGGMSVVYLARHELIDRLSAIKVLRPELSRVPEHRERFLREARAVNRINHENIVEISDVGESDGVAYLVMEYVQGESLLSHIQKGRLPWERAARIAVQIASALARTHQTGVIHRDLKPENVLLVPRVATAEGEIVKLTDFGIAKMMGEPSLTLKEQLFGTPGYIAPEYVDGVSVDGRADLYSLAVVLYEMVTGVLPFEGRGQSELLLKPLTSAPIPPNRRVQGLPPDLESLILRGLARQRDDRPHDAFAFHDELLAIVRRHGGTSSPNVEATAPNPSPREVFATVVDKRISQLPGRETANVGKLVTREMNTQYRWTAALSELESHIAKARAAGGESAAIAKRAAELAIVAGDMIPRVERATKLTSELQARVDRLEASGREFRANLGHAIDVLVHDRSRERAHLDALRTRREMLERALGKADAKSTDAPLPASLELPAGSDHRPWEAAAVADEERRAAGVVLDLQFQIDALQKQLDQKNETHEKTIMQATGSLEGALSGLRQLTNELARAIDDGIDMLQQTG
jgi:serine/threonine-protein kinase